jgi:hypothetical protein
MARLTVPENAPTAAIVSVLVPAIPTFAMTGFGLAVRLKVLPRLKLTTTLWLSVPLVPVTVTLNEPAAVAVQARVAVCGDAPKVTLAGMVQVTPAGLGAARFTVPVKPFKAAREIVEDPDSVEELTMFGDAVMLKSTTWKRIAAVV